MVPAKLREQCSSVILTRVLHFWVVERKCVYRNGRLRTYRWQFLREIDFKSVKSLFKICIGP